ncbi:Ras-related protein Rab-2A [Histomonas meleagridis]|nr:Ras-related protein Rab-2A [Histomonas meleagridis]
MTVEGKTVDVHLYDLVGAEIPKKPPPNYHLYLTRLEINGVILLYDITQKDAFQIIPEWIKSIRQSNSKVVIMLIGSKCDVDEKREVSFEEGAEFSKSENLIFYEASSIKEINVREAFAFWSRK